MIRYWKGLVTLTLRECSVYSPAGDTTKLICRYLEPVQVSGLYVPTRLEMRSAEGELAATIRLQDVAVNTGLDDGLFR